MMTDEGIWGIEEANPRQGVTQVLARAAGPEWGRLPLCWSGTRVMTFGPAKIAEWPYRREPAGATLVLRYKIAAWGYRRSRSLRKG
jgi:hypothetical protein